MSEKWKMITLKGILLPEQSRCLKKGCHCHERWHNGTDKKTEKDCSWKKRKKKTLKDFGWIRVNLLLEGGKNNKDPEHWNYDFPRYCTRVCYNKRVIMSSRETINEIFSW